MDITDQGAQMEPLLPTVRVEVFPEGLEEVFILYLDLIYIYFGGRLIQSILFVLVGCC